jgi:hypothetical protein
MNVPFACLYAAFPEAPAIQLAMTTQCAHQNGIRIGLNGCLDELLLGNKYAQVNDFEALFPQGIFHDFVTNHVGIHSQDA